MREEFLQSLIKNCGLVFEEMTGLQVTSVQGRRTKTAGPTFAVAQVIAFEELNRHLEGKFVLGFEEGETAVETASALAKAMGLPPVPEVNSEARALLDEFLNTIVGRTVSDWDSQGLSARFSPPREAEREDLNPVDITQGELQLVRIFADELHITLKTYFYGDAAGGLGEDGEPKARVLVVDDSEPVRMILTRALTERSYEVHQACNGLEGVAQYEKLRPDLVIMDLVMPEMGGLDAALEIRQKHPDSRILILTSSSRKDEVVTANTIGVSGYLIKPVQPPELLGKVDEVLRE